MGKTVKLRLVSGPPLDRTLLQTPNSDPSFVYFDGPMKTGGTEFTCGKCNRVLAKNLKDAGLVAKTVLKCPDCGSFNATRQGSTG